MKSSFSSLRILKHIFWGYVFVLGAFRAHGLQRQGEVLVYGIENEIKDYNISRSVDKNAFSLSELVTEGLFFLRPDGTLEPDLAKSYKREGRLWSFELRESRFSSGKKLGCEDVVANIEEARRSPRPVKARLREIESAKCDGEKLLIRTHGETPQLLRRMGYIIRVYDVSTLNEKNPVGSGPYKISGKEGKDIVLVPNPFYPEKAAYRQIRYRTLRDPWLRDLALLSGNVDFLLENFSLPRLRAFEQKREEVRVYRNPSPLLFYLVLRPDKFSLEQRRFVRAIFAREKIVESFWGKQTQVASTLFEKTNLESEVPTTPGRIAPFQIEVSLVADDTQVSFLRHVAKILSKYDVRLVLRPLEFVSHMKRLNSKNFDAYLFYVDTGHLQNLEALLHSRGNRLDIKDAELDRIFLEFSRSDSEPKSMALENALEARVYENAYLIPLYRPYKELVSHRSLQLDQSKNGFWRDILHSRKYNYLQK